jgi:hypothetical protein
MIVVYQSSTGFTKQYAQWIAEDLDCQAVALKEVSDRTLLKEDCVIFGGWLMGGMISGFSKVKKVNPEQLIVFAVGSTPKDIVDVIAISEQNNLADSPLFYMQGGFHFDSLNFMLRGMLKTMKRQISKKENKTAQEQFMADKLGTSFDSSDRSSIKDLVAYVQAK